MSKPKRKENNHHRHFSFLFYFTGIVFLLCSAGALALTAYHVKDKCSATINGLDTSDGVCTDALTSYCAPSLGFRIALSNSGLANDLYIGCKYMTRTYIVGIVATAISFIFIVCLLALRKKYYKFHMMVFSLVALVLMIAALVLTSIDLKHGYDRYNYLQQELNDDENDNIQMWKRFQTYIANSVLIGITTLYLVVAFCITYYK